MALNLQRPLAFLDLETTGISVAHDRIVEFSIHKVWPEGKRETWTQRVNPTIPIPAQSSAIHGIFDADVADEPTFEEVAGKLAMFLNDCDLAGYNSNKFDVPLLMEEFLRFEINFDLKDRKLIDVQNVFFKMEQRTLTAAYQFYCNKKLEDAHSAEVDTLATAEILEAQIERYDKIKNDMSFLAEFSQFNRNADLMGRIVFNNNDQEVFNFGKHKGKPVEEVLEKEPSYYGWMMKGDFPLYTKKVLTEIRNRSKKPHRSK